ncbi:unnamed protein product [Brachionus calyciflorus]|uniref:Uncharacterized protein n=1 Tax=Brachionus calyciflorus TaxID=104777 RepID=A0A814DV42_9BILA|nr:unnamed protein product [Brachionus calyciflorus]
METVLESKLVDNLSSIQDSYPLNFFSIYSFKQNKSNNSSQDNKSNNSSVLQYLERDANLNKDFSLTCLISNVPENNEGYLRENLAKRIERGTVCVSDSGNISNFKLGFKKENDEIESICYYYVHRAITNNNNNNNNENEIIICFLVDDSNYNLDLYRNELDFYVKECLIENLEDLSKVEEFRESFQKWYEIVCNYLKRILEYTNEKTLGSLLENAFSSNQVLFDDSLSKEIKFDLKLLINSLKYSLETNNNSGIISSKISLDKEKNSLIIEYDQNLSEFALECSICLRNENKADVENDFNLKQIIENFKLKVKFLYDYKIFLN